MRDYIELWFKNLIKRPSRSMLCCIEVAGERKKHVGPKIEYASVRMSIKPSDEFRVVNEIEENDYLESIGFPDYFIFGLLDVLMVLESSPFTKAEIVLLEVKFDPIESSPHAFLEAGRDAGNKIRIAMLR